MEKYELIDCHGGILFFAEIEVFRQERGHIAYVINQISDSKDKQKTDKIRSMTKKGNQKLIFDVNMEIVS